MPELRKKILYTLFIILIFRFGSCIPVPFIDTQLLAQYFEQASTNGSMLGYLDMFSGGGLSRATIFAMSITPYINASIILQLLTVAIPALERLARDGGEEGKKKIQSITRYATVAIAILQGWGYYVLMKNYGILTGSGVWVALVIIVSFIAGSSFVMWMGEQITEFGIGNGISIILFAGILSRVPTMVSQMVGGMRAGSLKWWMVLLVIVGILLLIVLITWVNGAERRIPVQYAKRVVGNKMYGGQNTHIPIKVNMSGVMPIIFASSILMLPTMILSFWKNENHWFYKVLRLFSVQGVFYAVIYFVLIIGFAYFYATIQFNPIEMANNLRKNGGAIPGIRPGKSTSDFISKILSRITLMGAIFLSVIAILPILIGSVGGINISLGGTSVLIMVGVALDTVRNLESQMMMRHYKGFLD